MLYLKLGLIGFMSIQLSEFTDMPLLFVILESCHCNFTNLQNTPLRTPSLYVFKIMEQNTPGLPPPPPLIPSVFLSISGQIPSAATPRLHATVLRGGQRGATVGG